MKTKGCQFDNLVVNGGTESCHYDGATSDDKVVKWTTFCFQCYGRHNIMNYIMVHESWIWKYISENYGLRRWSQIEPSNLLFLLLPDFISRLGNCQFDLNE